MGAGAYEFRTFTPVLLEKDFQAEITDLYIYKRGFTSVGVKIRDPELTEGGNYKFKKFEIKQMTKRMGELQCWVKSVGKFSEGFKLKHNKVDELNQLFKS